MITFCRKSFIKNVFNGQIRCKSANSVSLSYNKITGCVTTSNDSLPPVLIFHGLFGTKNNWKSISKAISSKTGRTVYSLDLRNHGSSPHTSGTDSTLIGMANDIELFLDDNHYKTATLIGHSLGGRTVLQFAYLWPERVEKLIAVDISPLPTIPQQFFTKTTFIDELSKSIENISNDLNMSSARKQVDDRLKPLITDAFIRGFFLMSLHKNEESEKLFWKFNLNSIKHMLENEYINKIEIKIPFNGPSLLVHGQQSDYVKKDDYNAIRELMPNVQIVSIPETGHYLHIEKPNHFIDCVISFMKLS
ncbi:protein ABHD11-like [Oppia nitens]|uniref:protein ABHD11-like n=1 Tax=Oppia nitens TaxID=1686743 RepID=UPI0023D9889C|nr:protein ABHD11-like [Oppia nitens]